MTRTQLKAERKVKKAKKVVNRVTHNFSVEFALDTLAFFVLVAIVVLAFLLDGVLQSIPENMDVPYLLMALYLAIYIVHKFIIMGEK